MTRLVLKRREEEVVRRPVAVAREIRLKTSKREEERARKKASELIREVALAATLEEARAFTEGFVQWEGE